MLHIAQMPHFYEQDYYTPGDHGMPVYATAAGRIGVAICYDRHYPEVMRRLGLQRADIVVVPQAARSVSGRMACTKRSSAWRRSRTATSPRWAIVSARNRR